MSVDELEKIEISFHRTEQCRLEVVKWWLKHHFQSATWGALVQALRKLKQHKLADGIPSHYEELLRQQNDALVQFDQEWCTFLNMIDHIHAGNSTQNTSSVIDECTEETLTPGMSPGADSSQENKGYLETWVSSGISVILGKKSEPGVTALQEQFTSLKEKLDCLIKRSIKLRTCHEDMKRYLAQQHVVTEKLKSWDTFHLEQQKDLEERIKKLKTLGLEYRNELQDCHQQLTEVLDKVTVGQNKLQEVTDICAGCSQTLHSFRNAMVEHELRMKECELELVDCQENVTKCMRNLSKKLSEERDSSGGASLAGGAGIAVTKAGVGASMGAGLGALVGGVAGLIAGPAGVLAGAAIGAKAGIGMGAGIGVGTAAMASVENDESKSAELRAEIEWHRSELNQKKCSELSHDCTETLKQSKLELEKLGSALIM